VLSIEEDTADVVGGGNGLGTGGDALEDGREVELGDAVALVAVVTETTVDVVVELEPGTITVDVTTGATGEETAEVVAEDAPRDPEAALDEPDDELGKADELLPVAPHNPTNATSADIRSDGAHVAARHSPPSVGNAGFVQMQVVFVKDPHPTKAATSAAHWTAQAGTV